MVDFSTSTTDHRDVIIDFLRRFLLPADIDSGDVRIGLLLYSHTVHIQFHLNEYNSKKGVFDKFANFPDVYGSTNTADAIKAMNDRMFTEENGDRPNVKNIGIVLTDGVSNIGSRRLPQEAERAKLNGIHIFAIGVGILQTEELKKIASVPASRNAFVLNGFEELRVFDERFFEFCPGMIVQFFRIFINTLV